MLVIKKKEKLKPQQNNKKKSHPPQQTISGSTKIADLQFAPKDRQAYSYIPPKDQI